MARRPQPAVPLLVLVLLLLAFLTGTRFGRPAVSSMAPRPLSVDVLHARVAALEAELEKRNGQNADVSVPPLVVAATSPPSAVPTTCETRAPAKVTPWLTIVIPTVPRAGAAVLQPTIRSVVDEVVNAGFDEAVRVVVMNNRPGQHKAFVDARKEFSTYRFVWFLENTAPIDASNASSDDPEFANRHQELPSPSAVRQTMDVVALLAAVENSSRYVLFHEDDFHFCKRALAALQHMIRKANAYAGIRGWSAIRCSFGLAGILMQNGAGGTHSDIAAIRRYFMAHARRRPPDHLAVEFYAKESRAAERYFAQRQVFAFRYNIGRHDGRVSTLREQAPWATPGCFHELVVPQVFEVEAWDPRACPHDDLWPCDGAPRHDVLNFPEASN